MLLSRLPIGFPKACCRRSALSDLLDALRAAGVQMKAIERRYRQYLWIGRREVADGTGGVFKTSTEGQEDQTTRRPGAVSVLIGRMGTTSRRRW